MRFKSHFIAAICAFISLTTAGLATASVIVSDSAPFAPGTPVGTSDYFGAPNATLATGYYPTPSQGEVFTMPSTVGGAYLSFTLYLYGSPGSVEGGLSIWTPSTAGTINTDGGTFGGTTGAPLYLSSPINTPATIPGGALYTSSFLGPLTAYTFYPDVTLIAGKTYIAYLTVLDSSGNYLSDASTFVALALGAYTCPGCSSTVPPPTPTGADYSAWNNNYYCNPSCPLSNVNPDLNPNDNPTWLQPTFPDNADFVLSVPEPAVWGLMVLGLGGLGAALRARRKRAPATA